MALYNVSSVLYARVTDANLAIASSNSGGTATSTIEEIIEAPTLATGKITTFAASTTVIGSETDFVNDYSEGQYLYYYNADGTPKLLGQIASREGSTMVLVDDALEVVVNKNAGAAGIKLTGNENILLRVPVVPRIITNNVVVDALIPNLLEWRATNSNAGENSINNPNTSAIIRYSNPGDVVSVDTTSSEAEKNVDFTIRNLNVFSAGNTALTYFPAGQIPNYIWFLINPYGKTDRNLAQSTMFKLFTKIVFTNGLPITANTPERILTSAGYTLKF